MRKLILMFSLLIMAVFFNVVIISYAEMSSENFILSISVLDNTGTTKSSDNFNLLDTVGQPTPIGPSASDNFNLEAGFIYGTLFSMPLDKTIDGVIEGLNEILANDPLTKQEKKKIEMAIKFLEDALDAWALYEAGDADALANALNKTKSAINKMIDSAVDTEIYQKMLAQASQITVTTEINSIASTAGDSDPNVIQARVFLSDGSAEVLNADYFNSVQSFTQAYNEALLAV